jgi:general secretion pathway protein D
MMMMIKKYCLLTFLLMGLQLNPLFSQSIAEKKANVKPSDSDLDQETEQFLVKINQETEEIRTSIQQLHEQAYSLHESQADPEEYQALLAQINQQKEQLIKVERSWRELCAKVNRTELYGLWHAPETTLEQLIIDYGSQDYVYLIPAEVGSIKLSVDSNLPIPRSAWPEMLELILAQNGVGIQNLNPYLRQLYLLKKNHSNLRLITNQRCDLEYLPVDVRVSFVLSPDSSEVRRTYAFLEKFINPMTTVLQPIGRDILVIGPVGELRDLLKLYDFVAGNRDEKDYRLIPVFKTEPEEMAKILELVFDQGEPPMAEVETAKGVKLVPTGEKSGLRVVVLQSMARSLFVVGTKEEVKQAEDLVQNVECQIGGARDRTVFWYHVKHSDAEELADVLYRVYSLMVETGAGVESNNSDQAQNNRNPDGSPNGNGPPPPQQQPPSTLYGQEGFYQEGGFIVNPAPVEPRAFKETEANLNRDNFIVDLKTSAIVMVVEADLLPKLKELLRKLDVPKKMVQIETLLFEKVLSRNNNFGLNLLRIGEECLNKNITDILFNGIAVGKDHKGKGKGHGRGLDLKNAGIFEFFISRKKHGSTPAFDLAYRFLLSQDDIQINSTPSILTVNQTPATIAIKEEQSINTGIFEVETAKGVTLKDAFTRAQYGITISIKPTIHMRQEGDESQDYDYVTLETDITFDTEQPSGSVSQPNVIRRHIENEVQVVDGETVVLGGLRSKVSKECRESLPFIGELPGIGKFFSITETRESSREMYIFITPRIVKDPKDQLACLRQELLCVRPGDVPYFLECIEEAHHYEKSRLLVGSMTMLFGKQREHYYITDCCQEEDGCQGEYDGR